VKPEHACTGGCRREPPADHFALRPSNEGDLGFIVHSWTESWHRNSPEMRQVRFGVFRNAMRRRAVSFAARCTTLVACDPGDHSHVLGWACVEQRGGLGVVHYVYVRETRREHGLAAHLVRQALARAGCAEGAPWVFTHATYVGVRIAGRKGHGCDGYNPVITWESEQEAKSA
jgi:GNAT superfamily N-acetyltransferase